MKMIRSDESVDEVCLILLFFAGHGEETNGITTSAKGSLFYSE
jgi:hypothetical protein